LSRSLSNCNYSGMVAENPVQEEQAELTNQ
jgi:hypothetical protein